MHHSIHWSPEYQTGNVMEDHEHNEIVRLADNLLIANEKNRSIIVIEDVLTVLHRYIELHFANEEKLLKDACSKYLDIQRVQHNVLKQELNAFWEPGNPVPSKQEVCELILWIDSQLLQHFKVSDFSAFTDHPFISGTNI